jgi:hypothetical protein
MAPVTRAVNRLRSTVEGLHPCGALHRFESRGHSRCVFPSVFCSLSPPSCLPWLHGHYPASALLRRLCHLPGTVLRALPAAMNAAPSRIVIPDSSRSNFLPFYHHPPHAFRFPRSLSRRGSVSLCCRSPFPGSFPFWASPFPRRLANASGRIVFNMVLFMDWQFVSGCSPPRLSTTQLPSTTDSQCSVRQGLSPRCWCALSGARGRPLRRRRETVLTSGEPAAARDRSPPGRLRSSLRRTHGHCWPIPWRASAPSAP